MANTAGKGELEYKKLMLAVEAGKRRDYKKALNILHELITGSFAPAEAWLLLGRTFHNLKEYSRAIAAFNDYIRQKPQSGQAYLFMGRTYVAAGMAQRAVPILRKALELLPANVQAMALLGMAYLKSRHSQQAVDMLQAAVQAAAKTGNNIEETEYRRIYRAYLNALLVRGVRLCRDGEYDLGRQMLGFVLENSEYKMDSPYLRLELGRACRESKKMEEALEHYTKALEFAPDDRRIRWSRVSILMALGQNDRAVKEIEAIRAIEPGVPHLPWNSRLVDVFMIRSFVESGEWRSAGQLCRNILTQKDIDSEDYAIVHALYAEALRNLGDYKAAHNHLGRAQEEQPNELEFWYADILVCWQAKDWKSLKKALTAAKDLGGQTDVIERFTTLYKVHTSRDDRKTLTMLQDAVRRLGPEPEIMYALGETYLKLGLAEQAKGWFEKTIVFKDRHEKAWLGDISALEILFAEKTPDAAQLLEKQYNKYLERWPDNYSIRRERALFLVKIAEYGKAAKELEKLLLKEPSNQSLRRVLAYSYRKTGRYREAAIYLKALLREKPRSLSLLLEYSGCIERIGGIHHAIVILEKARGIFKDSSQLLMALGMFYFKTKKTEAAFDCLREAARLDKTDPRPYEWMAVIAKKNKDAEHCRYYYEQAQKRKKLSQTPP